jgi:hypothetical protein
MIFAEIKKRIFAARNWVDQFVGESVEGII